MAFLYMKMHDDIFWTKRYVRYRECGIRNKIRREKYKNRVHKRIPLFLIRELNMSKRKPINLNKPQRQNFNSFYRPICLRS